MAMARLLPSLLLLGLVAALWSGMAPTCFVGGPALRRTPSLQLSRGRQQASVAMRGGKNSKVGIFSPLVEGAKAALGQERLTQLRGEVIKAHSKAIAEFVDSSQSPSGHLAMKKLFEAADADGSSKLDTEEVRKALGVLGFHWMTTDKKVEDLVKKSDTDKDGEISFEEFAKVMPKILRQNLVKLAKENGNNLGFLV